MSLVARAVNTSMLQYLGIKRSIEILNGFKKVSQRNTQVCNNYKILMLTLYFQASAYSLCLFNPVSHISLKIPLPYLIIICMIHSPYLSSTKTNSTTAISINELLLLLLYICAKYRCLIPSLFKNQPKTYMNIAPMGY